MAIDRKYKKKHNGKGCKNDYCRVFAHDENGGRIRFGEIACANKTFWRGYRQGRPEKVFCVIQ
jgi:hypothetical protein